MGMSTLNNSRGNSSSQSILTEIIQSIMHGRLFVLSGPSGAGKGTICRSLLSRFAEVKLSISATTRPPRPGEIEGTHYFFLSREIFERNIEDNAFLEWAQVYDNLYGTPVKPVEEALTQGTDVILEIDIQGALQVRERYPQAILVFVAPPSLEELDRRIRGRATDCEEVINKRLSLASSELGYIDKYDYCIVNDNLEKSVSQLQAIIVAERCRLKGGFCK